MKNILRIFILFICFKAYTQNITEQLVFKSDKSSINEISERIAFDRKGTYCFLFKRDGQDFFITNTGIIGGFKSISATFGMNGGLYQTDQTNEQSPFFYKNVGGTKVFGPVYGKLENYQTSNTKEHIALVATFQDSVFYYINGKQVLKEAKDSNVSYDDDWAAFSENGNVIYSLHMNNAFSLYVNDSLIDRSEFGYTQLAINNEGVYIYAEVNKPEKSMEKYDYRFFIHTPDTVLEHVRTVWNYELRENGAYYYSGDDNGPYYIAVNNRLYKNINGISNITLPDKNTYLYSFEEGGKNKINVNGRIYTPEVDQMFYPTLDKKGNFAFYGIKDYYLYKFVNGEKEEEPVTKYGVRATPLYISPKGTSMHYFQTDDSLYVYKDENLLFPPLAKGAAFFIKPSEDFLPYSVKHGKATNGNSLFYMEYGQNGYLVFNGLLSKPVIPVKEEGFSAEQAVGTVVAADFNDSGFFIIQKTGPTTYQIIVNNEIYEELKGITHIVRDNCFFNEKELVFYGVKGTSFYQFKLNL